MILTVIILVLLRFIFFCCCVSSLSTEESNSVDSTVHWLVPEVDLVSCSIRPVEDGDKKFDDLLQGNRARHWETDLLYTHTLKN